MLKAISEAASVIRLGRIGFINTVPLYNGFQQALPQALQTQVQVVSQTPMGLNEAIIKGDLDISPVSTAWYAQHPEQLTLLPGLSISSAGSVESVLLISDFALNQWQGQPIAVPDDSATSIAALQALIHHHSGADPSNAFVVYPAHLQEQALREYPAVLTIGDRALAWQHRPSATAGPATKQTIDLATAWHAWTGDPLVFALWVARREWLSGHVAEASAIMMALKESKDAFVQSDALQQAVYQTLQGVTDLSDDVLKRYWTQSLDYSWSERHQASVDRLATLIDTQRKQPCFV